MMAPLKQDLLVGLNLFLPEIQIFSQIYTILNLNNFPQQKKETETQINKNNNHSHNCVKNKHVSQSSLEKISSLPAHCVVFVRGL